MAVTTIAAAQDALTDMGFEPELDGTPSVPVIYVYVGNDPVYFGVSLSADGAACWLLCSYDMRVHEDEGTVLGDEVTWDELVDLLEPHMIF